MRNRSLLLLLFLSCSAHAVDFRNFVNKESALRYLPKDAEKIMEEALDAYKFIEGSPNKWGEDSFGNNANWYRLERIRIYKQLFPEPSLDEERALEQIDAILKIFDLPVYVCSWEHGQRSEAERTNLFDWKKKRAALKETALKKQKTGSSVISDCSI